MSLADTLDQLKELDFNDLDFERIGTWPIAGRIFIWIMVFILILVGAYFFKVKDLNASLNREVAKETQLRTTFNNRAYEAANLDAYRNQMMEMEEAFGALLSQLPKDSEVPGLLEDITERGNAAGLEIKGIDLQEEVIKEFYVELPISINVVGGYHQLGSFVSGVASLPRIVTLHNYSIDKNDRGALLEMKILAKTYRYKPQE
ncbi:type 4a pilus biogenesis protein PilO [Sessilibacter corallicola]|uniref:type 4a pilus biogenesis protein PilO n=1 Tax=Sessilibacter corallicola TaxID=2904075 RepID=UPI001E4B7A6E|nr:type 4a pilus biogenesis protein PilO [Sessilibacter corallicola]MCE2027648.1 type 4a pilus biogenesis protein PilO [Sessilibacter corallicola]